LVYLVLGVIAFNVLRKVYAVLNRKPVKNEVVLITGGASGLGRRMAIKFAALGAKLVLWDINEAGLNKVAKEIKDSGGVVWTYKCDISKKENVYEAAAKVLTDAGRVDILINNAGIVHGKSILADDWRDEMAELTMAINTNAHFWTTRAFVRDMAKRNHGHLVTIASAAGLQGPPALADYAASKFGAYGFNESVRRDLLKAGINGVHTTVICPFYINTGMFEGVKSAFPLLQILDEEYVCQSIVDAVRENNPFLGLPWLIHYSHLLIALLPTTWSDKLLMQIGVASSMDSFVGRKKTN